MLTVSNLSLDEIDKRLADNGLRLIRLESFEVRSSQLDGNLDDLVSAANAFGEQVVFSDAYELTSDDFYLEVESPVVGQYAEPPVDGTINLAQFSPKVEEFRNRVGEINLIILTVLYCERAFSLWMQTEWHQVFTELIKVAEEAYLLAEKNAEINKQAEESARDVALISLMKTLSEDENFWAMRTQRAKLEFALAKYPELRKLPFVTLRDEISNLVARAEALKKIV